MATKTRPATRPMASKVKAAVKEQFAEFLASGGPEPRVVMDFDWSGSPTPSVVWPEGPFGWALVAFGGGVVEDSYVVEPVAPVPGVWTEPATIWALSVYRSA